MPQTEMITLNGKLTDTLDFGPAFRKYIAEEYEQDPSLYVSDLAKLNTLRTEARNAPPHETGRATLLRYLAELSSVETRFPCNEGGIRLSFTWYDSFTGKSVSQHSIAYEKACVLFNIFAILSQMAGSIERGSEGDGVKRACNLFEAAAGTLQHLNDAFMHAPTVDMSRDSLAILIELMTAQAQECYWEKGVREKMSLLSIARLSASVAALYEKVHELVTTATASISKSSMASWAPTAKAKSLHFRSVMHFHVSLAKKEESKFGEQVAHHRRSFALAQDALRASKGLFPGLVDAISRNQSLVARLLPFAEKDNDTVYHERVPSLESLADPEAMQMAKPTAFCGAPQPSLFARLLPITAIVEISKYDDSVASVVRRAVEVQEQADAEMERAFNAMELPQSLDKAASVADDVLSEDLIRCIAADAESGGASAFVAAVAAITSASSDVAGQFAAVEAKVVSLTAESVGAVTGATDAEADEFVQKLADYRAHLATARATDAALAEDYERVRVHCEAVSRGLEGVQAVLPKRDLLAEGSLEEERIVTELRGLVQQVEALRARRHVIVSEVRRTQAADNVGALIAFCFHDAPAVQRVFDEQLSKYAHFEAELKSNAAEQTKLIVAVASANASLVEQRGSSAEKSARNAMQAAMVASHSAFVALQASVGGGANFYRDIADALDELSAAVDSVRDERARVRREKEEAVRREKEEAVRRQEIEAREAEARLARLTLLSAGSSTLLVPAPSEADAGGQQGAAERFMQHFDLMRLERAAAAAEPHAAAAGGFIAEYQRVCVDDRAWQASPAGQAAVQSGLEFARAFPEKNRYRDICPYAHARVRLPGDGYINATSFAGLVRDGPSYIAAQGPLASTVGDFWWMVWHYKSPQVYMLTAEIEGMKIKCHRYWPADGEAAVHDTLGVASMGPAVPAVGGSELRVFRLTNLETGETRDLQHFTYAAWPDHGVPASLEPIASLVAESLASALAHRDGTAIVHCSAGVGRTGSFIAMALAVDALRRGVRVAIPDIVSAMRRCRPSMVQTPLQYEIVHRVTAITAETLCGRQRLPSANARMPPVPLHRPPPPPRPTENDDAAMPSLPMPSLCMPSQRPVGAGDMPLQNGAYYAPQPQPQQLQYNPSTGLYQLQGQSLPGMYGSPDSQQAQYGGQYAAPEHPHAHQAQYQQPQGQAQYQAQYAPPYSQPHQMQQPQQPQQQQYAQAPYVQQQQAAGYGQPQYGQAQYGQPQYGQAPPYAQPPYGPPPHGNAQYGQQQQQQQYPQQPAPMYAGGVVGGTPIKGPIILDTPVPTGSVLNPQTAPTNLLD